MAGIAWPLNLGDGGPTYDARKLRQTQLAPLVGGATAARPLGGRSGVRPGTSTATVTATSTTWTVKPHAGILDVLTPSEAGPYGYAIDADETGSVTAASGSNPRVDIVYVTLADTAEGTGGTTGVTFGYTAGTPAASPVAPATPARSMVLAWINVPVSGGGSPTVTFKAPYAAGPGGIIPVRDTAERNLITFGSAENPVYVHRLSADTLERSVASGVWRTVAGPTSYLSSVGGVGPVTADTVITTLTAPAPGFAYRVQVDAQVRVDLTGGTADYVLEIRHAASGQLGTAPTTLDRCEVRQVGGTLRCRGIYESASGAAREFGMFLARAAGSGTGSVTNASSVNRLDMLVTPL